jgi:hypothetical protein
LLQQRAIDFDPFELTIEEKIFRSLKRLCAIFAAGAVALGVLDMTNIRSVDAAVEFLHDSSARIVELPDRVVALPDRIRTEIRNISLLPAALPASLSAQATAVIPRDEAKAARPVVLASARADVLPEIKQGLPSTISRLTEVSPVAEKALASPVAQLAAAQKQDAIDLAMAPPALPAAAAVPSAAPKAELPGSLAQAFVPAEPAPQQVAAAEPIAAAEPSIEPTPVSLPMASVIPLDMVPLPRPAPGAPPPSPAERLHLEGKDYAKAERCLANAVYFESRSEPVRGQMAVAQVVLNRVFSGFYPKDVCSVVYQNADHYLGCQFTFACDGKRKLINERGAWARANRISKQTLDGQVYLSEVGKSTHYHALYVHPNWVHEMHRLARYGIHAFYRPIAWGNGAEEPVWGSAALAQNKK